jgi:hypothetical protein
VKLGNVRIPTHTVRLVRAALQIAMLEVRKRAEEQGMSELRVALLHNPLRLEAAGLGAERFSVRVPVWIEKILPS